jgi:hypothetical protein
VFLPFGLGEVTARYTTGELDAGVPLADGSLPHRRNDHRVRVFPELGGDAPLWGGDIMTSSTATALARIAPSASRQTVQGAPCEKLIARDKANLDITWLSDESLDDKDNPPALPRTCPLGLK